MREAEAQAETDANQKKAALLEQEAKAADNDEESTSEAFFKKFQ